MFTSLAVLVGLVDSRIAQIVNPTVVVRDPQRKLRASPQLIDTAVGEEIGALVTGVASVTLDPVPADVVRF